MKLLILISLLFASSILCAQELGSRHSIQLELGGHAFFYSLNYEGVIHKSEKIYVVGQIGLGYHSPNSGFINLWIPVTANLLFPTEKGLSEIGLGYVFTNDLVPVYDKNGQWKEKMEVKLTGRIGFRWQKPERKIFYRLAFTPLIQYDYEQWYFWPWLGASIGITL